MAAKAEAVAAGERREDDLRRQGVALNERIAQLDLACQQAEADLRHQQDLHRQQLQALREELETQKRTAAATKTDLNGLYQQELKLRQALETTVDQERLLRGEAESRISKAAVCEKKAGKVGWCVKKNGEGGLVGGTRGDVRREGGWGGWAGLSAGSRLPHGRMANLEC